MNRIIIYAGILLSVVFTSCSDFLDTTSPSQVTPEYVFNSEYDILVAISGVYSVYTQDALYNSRFIKTYCQNTDVEFWTVGPTSTDFKNYMIPTGNTDVQNTWQYFYQAIDRANNVIDGIRAYEMWQQADTTKASTLTQLMGEARTLRAMMYLDMTRLWGDVPFRTTASTPDEDFRIPATPRHRIWEWLIDDLIRVEPVMQYASEIENGVERAAREFCQGLIALIAMNRGGWYLRPWDGNEPAGVQGDPDVGYMYRHDDYLSYYEIARQYAKKVWDDNRHSLTYSYEKLWYEITNDRYATGDDILFAIPLRGGEYAYAAGIAVDKGNHPYGSCGGGATSSIMYYVSFDKEDLRRDVTCVPYKYNSSLDQAENFKTLASMENGKWNRIAIESPLGKESEKSSGIDYVYMRYADVLLLFAEAENELNGPTDSAKMALKTVRRRAFAAENHSEKVEQYVDGLGSKEDFFEAIMNERKFEFGGEQIRRFDLARWNKYGEKLTETYEALLGWAKTVAGYGEPQYQDLVREKVWYRSVEDPNNPGRTILEFWGLSEQKYVKPQDETADEWEEKVLIKDWYKVDDKTEEVTINDYIKGSFYGYINPDNAGTFDPAVKPVRYLFPIPNTAISDHGGALKNYYGY